MPTGVSYPADNSTPWTSNLKKYIDSVAVLFITQTAHGLAVGDVVRHNGTNYVKAQADSIANAEAVGMVSAVADANNFSLHNAGPIGGLSGLTAGQVRFLSPTTAGATTATEPTTIGQVSKPVLISTSTTAGVYLPMRGIVVTGSEVEVIVTDPASTFTTGDGKAYYLVTSRLNGKNLVGVAGALSTVGSTATQVQIRNVTDSFDMLTTKLTIDASEPTSYTAAAPAIDAAHDDVATGDILSFDIDAAGTNAKGLMVALTFA